MRRFILFPATSLVLLLAAGLGGCSAASETAEPISEVVSFGDSWSDAGTFGFVFGTSEGGSWPQLLAQEYGATQKSNRLAAEDGTETKLGGANYAEGGAFVAPMSEDTTGPKPMTTQLETYLEDHGSFRPDQLVTVWAGGNDIITLLGNGDPERTERFSTGTILPEELEQTTRDVIGLAQTEADFVQDIVDAGAEHVIVLNMIELGITDNADNVQDGGNHVLSALSLTFNAALSEALPAEPSVALFDAASLMRDVQGDPESFGYTVVDGDACTGGAYSCGPDAWVVPDADRTYAFAGYGHFTLGTRELIAKEVHELVTSTWGD
jgi:phospholipase/lecithinase/hemolysin